MATHYTIDHAQKIVLLPHVTIIDGSIHNNVAGSTFQETTIDLCQALVEALNAEKSEDAHTLAVALLLVLQSVFA